MLKIVTSESVNIGHPDKTCDTIADSFLDEVLKQDPRSQMAVECAIKNDKLFVYGEATTKAEIDYAKVAKQTLKEIGIPEEMLPTLANQAINDPCTPGNPREVTVEDIINIYKAAY